MKSETRSGYSTTAWGSTARLSSGYYNSSTVTAANVMKSMRRPGPATLDLLGSHLTLQHWALVFLYLQTPWFVRYARFWWMSYGDLYLLGNAQHISKSGIYVWQLVFQRIIGCFVCTNINQRFKAIKFHIHVLLENNSLDFCFNHLPHQKKLEVPFSSVNMYSNQDV